MFLKPMEVTMPTVHISRAGIGLPRRDSTDFRTGDSHWADWLERIAYNALPTQADENTRHVSIFSRQPIIECTLSNTTRNFPLRTHESSVRPSNGYPRPPICIKAGRNSLRTCGTPQMTPALPRLSMSVQSDGQSR